MSICTKTSRQEWLRQSWERIGGKSDMFAHVPRHAKGVSRLNSVGGIQCSCKLRKKKKRGEGTRRRCGERMRTLLNDKEKEMMMMIALWNVALSVAVYFSVHSFTCSFVHSSRCSKDFTANVWMESTNQEQEKRTEYSLPVTLAHSVSDLIVELAETFVRELSVLVSQFLWLTMWKKILSTVSFSENLT